MYIFIVDHLINEFANREVILFGAGSCGEKCLEEFKKIGTNILAFCDNNQSIWGNKFLGYPVLSPEELKLYPEIPVLITSTYDDEIREQLRKLEIKQVYTVKIGVLHDKIPLSNFHNGCYNKKEINELLYHKILEGNPLFVGRLGSTELECISEYFYLLDRVNGSNIPYGNNMKMILKEWTGFYPTNEEAMDRFCELYREKLSEIDILTTMWNSRFEDRLFSDFCPHRKIGSYDDIAFPIEQELPWTYALKGKKVLVIHPFELSIQRNYRNRKLLFQNPNFLPEFELKTIRAVQSIAFELPAHPTWFHALDYMKQQMKQIDFDIALIGAGGYGFPLAAYAKELGKQGILIGGMLQLYFGICGKNWDNSGYYNQFWTRPLEEEKPSGYQRVEAGRYW